MKQKHLIPALVLLLLLTALSAHADVYGKLKSNNKFLNPLPANNVPVDNSAANLAADLNFGMQGEVISRSLFQEKNTIRRTGGLIYAGSDGYYRGFSTIAAYNNISTADVGATHPTIRRASPPPTPIIEPDKQLFLGDALLFLLLLLAAYALRRKLRIER